MGTYKLEKSGKVDQNHINEFNIDKVNINNLIKISKLFYTILKPMKTRYVNNYPAIHLYNCINKRVGKLRTKNLNRFKTEVPEHYVD